MWCDPHLDMFKVEETQQGVRDDIQLPWFVLNNRKIVRLKRDCSPCKHVRCILHGIQVTKSAVIRNTNEMAPHM